MDAIVMIERPNPLKLNPLQLKTLVIFQELARHPESSTKLETGEILLTNLPKPHGDHFHVGRKVAASKDATGLANAAVWAVLEKKGLIVGSFPYALHLTPAGQTYQTGLETEILQGSHH
jgi:hypothetical protein